jgi:hypothetical protein
MGTPGAPRVVRDQPNVVVLEHGLEGTTLGDVVEAVLVEPAGGPVEVRDGEVVRPT